ncbi:MAG: hypothetical protein P1S60_16380, partial [Anaerolineae bacterium]|nr:hypothetical protein [Anaerolineae bacterium]
TGLFTSLAFSNDDKQHISYYFYDPTGPEALKYARYVYTGGNCGFGNNAGKWQCDTIHSGEGIGQFTALALDTSDNAHIAYYNRHNGDLWYATNQTGSNCGPGNTWTCYPIVITGDVGKYAAMYVDPQSNFHIAYYEFITASGGNLGIAWQRLQAYLPHLPFSEQ